LKLYLSSDNLGDAKVEAIKDCHFRYGIEMKFLMSFWFFIRFEKKTKKWTFSKENKTLESIRRVKNETGLDLKMLLDSGVFSARKKGITLPTELLAEFYHEYSDIFEYVFSMDEGTIEQQIENIRILKNENVPVIGIFHPGSIEKPFMTNKHLNEIMDITDFISYSDAFIPTAQREKILDNIFNEVYKRGYKGKSHYLGMESPVWLSQYPFYSADASTYIRNVNLGEIFQFDQKNWHGLKKINIKRNMRELVRTDINYCKCQDRIEKIEGEWTGPDVRTYYNILNRAIYQKFLTDLWSKRGVTWN